jgi:hypothetical protein
MKRNFAIIILSFILLVAINVYFYNNFFDFQISHQKNILQKQTKVCVAEIERVVQKFESDLNYILFSDDVDEIFSSEDSDGLRKLQLFYSNYNELIKNIDIYDNNKNVLNVFRDRKKNFITDNYIAQRQRNLSVTEEVVMSNNQYQYILPVFKENKIFANILVTINITDYILAELEKFHLDDYTWQWAIDVVNDKIYTAHEFNFNYFEKQESIINSLKNDFGDIVIHEVKNDSLSYNFLTVFSPIIALNKKFGVAMSVDYTICVDQIRSKLILIPIISILIFLSVTILLSIQIVNLKKKIKD